MWLAMAGDTTTLVRELAAIYGVSERTIWRWFATIRVTAPPDRRALDYLPPLPEPQRRCQHCQCRLPKTATFRRHYCSDRCRAAAHYWRKPRAKR